MKDYSLTGTEPRRDDLQQGKTPRAGRHVGGIQKWKHKLEEAKEQENFPVKV
jgi:hypothetical protein